MLDNESEAAARIASMTHGMQCAESLVVTCDNSLLFDVSIAREVEQRLHKRVELEWELEQEAHKGKESA